MYAHNAGVGYGFCEYEDKETAMSARRNLNGTELNGRALRVDLTENDKQNAANAAAAAAAAVNQSGMSTSKKGAHTVPHPTLPAGLGGPAPAIAMMSMADIHDTMIKLKQAVVESPNDMREFLLANPQEAHAILQAQIMLGMVPPPMMPPSHAPPQPVGTVPNAPRMQPMAPPGLMPRAPMMPPPIPGQPPPPPPPQQPPAQQPQSLLDNEQAALLNRVMSMTPQQIDHLPPDQREKVLQLQATVNSQIAAANAVAPGSVPGQPPQRPYR